jgi:hypothetical protein
VNRPRWIVCFGLLLLLANMESFGGVVRFPGIPTRTTMIIQYIPAPGNTPQLPPPTAPGLGAGAQLSKEVPPVVEMPKLPAPPPTPPVLSEAETAKKAKLKSERERLNHNTLLWQIDRAQAGSPSAMGSLGMRFLSGNGLEKDEAQARQWLQKGADAGDSVSKRELGRMDAGQESEKKQP